MVIRNSHMDIYKSIMDSHNSFIGIHNCIMEKKRWRYSNFNIHLWLPIMQFGILKIIKYWYPELWLLLM